MTQFWPPSQIETFAESLIDEARRNPNELHRADDPLDVWVVYRPNRTFEPSGTVGCWELRGQSASGAHEDYVVPRDMELDARELLAQCMRNAIINDRSGNLAARGSPFNAPSVEHPSGSHMHCPQCGVNVDSTSRYCSNCGGPLDRDNDTSTARTSLSEEQVFVDAVEGKVAWGRSVFMNLFAGSASEVNCRFTARRVFAGGTEELVSVPFFKEVNIPIEEMAGLYRTQAQQALDELDRYLVRDGWRRVNSAGPWYSRRYVRARV